MVEMDDERVSCLSLPSAKLSTMEDEVDLQRGGGKRFDCIRNNTKTVRVHGTGTQYCVRRFFTAGGPGNNHSRGIVYLSHKQACEPKGISPPPQPLSPQDGGPVWLGGCSRMSRLLGCLVT